ncbi:MAG: DUF2764 domain-containing protein [Candidatus Omnitrophica bacterium]|nr:DUF2764 domain-containing protein [Candidatus Omnitrophota bacterium]MCM8830770.1 DUF2764 domain-containing protein [Candidatus Omnitrophota bacterium]
MLKFYPYLVSSLFPLNFEAQPPYSFEEFIDYCARFLSEEQLEILKNISLEINFKEQSNSLLKKWQDFNIALKNALLEFRAQKLQKSPTEYIKETSYSYFELKKDVYFAFKAIAPEEQEKILDKLRWQFLEEEEKKHIFVLESLIIYGLKLLILLRWENIKKYSNLQTLKEVLEN